mmetsp:Transcript_100041/g.188299  ORF Transcript_100041/g.188299 Transcript_100041/m.188299 type:complete len:232 (-) Transcript_100041:588-1283(-)
MRMFDFLLFQIPASPWLEAPRQSCTPATAVRSSLRANGACRRTHRELVQRWWAETLTLRRRSWHRQPLASHQSHHHARARPVSTWPRRARQPRRHHTRQRSRRLQLTLPLTPAPPLPRRCLPAPSRRTLRTQRAHLRSKSCREARTRLLQLLARLPQKRCLTAPPLQPLATPWGHPRSKSCREEMRRQRRRQPTSDRLQGSRKSTLFSRSRARRLRHNVTPVVISAEISAE